MASEVTFIYDLLVAIAVGALVGIEREHHRDEHIVLAGIRTFPLVSVSGFIVSYLAVLHPDLSALVMIGLAIVAIFAIGLLYIQYELKIPGFTTPLAFIVSYFSGVLIGYGHVLEAVVLAVATTFLLISKRHLHRFAQLLTEGEIIGALEFITISFILYPLALELHLTGSWAIFGRGGALDLSTTILIVIFVSSISFVSFLIVRWKGPSRGLRFSGLLGGLVNSEAATASICGLANERKGIVGAAASGVVLANATMFIRNLAVCMFADPTLSTASIVALPLFAVSIIGIGIGMMMKVEMGGKEPMKVTSPFAIVPALRFGIIFVVVSAATILIHQYVGAEAVYLTAIGGFISSAAVAASVSTLTVTGQVDPWIAAETILIACAISSLNKLLISRTMSRDVFSRSRTALLLTTAATLAALAATFAIRIVL
ncbi:MAG: DUF4010 domain-containing protein [Methanomassiliicoccales archaeon]|nr:DUF4010 domain-containing protein [Methanomassiliicoccales archaeon]